MSEDGLRFLNYRATIDEELERDGKKIWKGEEDTEREHTSVRLQYWRLHPPLLLPFREKQDRQTPQLCCYKWTASVVTAWLEWKHLQSNQMQLGSGLSGSLAVYVRKCWRAATEKNIQVVWWYSHIGIGCCGRAAILATDTETQVQIVFLGNKIALTLIGTISCYSCLELFTVYQSLK